MGAQAACAGLMDVEYRGASGDLLHRVVREGWAELRDHLEPSDRYLPGYVVREVERYLWCGDPRLGFAWLTCDDCDQHRLAPFSCKGRGFCPSCCDRRMAERAARWVDELLPLQRQPSRTLVAVVGVGRMQERRFCPVQ